MVICNIVHLTSVKEKQPDVYEVDRTDHFDEEWEPPFNPKEVVRIKTSEKFSDSYDLYEILGEGKYGKVYKCQEKHTRLDLAAKCIRLRKDADRVAVEKEVAIMTQMRHKCIAQIYDAFATSSTDIILVMEIIYGGELFDRVVEENYILTEPAVALIIYQLCEAVRYIHENHILHLDLKPENIMCVSHTGNQIKLIDFGLAQYYDGESDLLFMAGTPEFAAPEVIKFEPLNFHTDMWSVGVITYILLSGISPFLGDNTGETYLNVEKGEWEFVEEFDENGISDDAKNFISKLLLMDKNKRLLPSECLTHSWLVSYKDKAKNIDLLNQPNEGAPLDTTKLRKYVKNQKFRKAVFGVLFINSVVKALQMLQASKSEHGIQYVKNMLNAADKENAATSLFKKISKRPRTSKKEDAPSTSSGLSTDELHFHAKPKRQNRKKEDLAATAVLDMQVGEINNAESLSPTPAPSPTPKKKKAVVAITRKDAGDVVEVVKKVKKIRKPKVSAATSASSTEELAKKPKRSTSTKKKSDDATPSPAAHEHGEIAVSALQALTTVEIPMSIPDSRVSKKPEPATTTKSFEIGEAKSEQKRPGKSVLQNRKLPFGNDGAAPFILPVAAYTPKPKKVEDSSSSSLLSPSKDIEVSSKSPASSREPSPSPSSKTAAFESQKENLASPTSTPKAKSSDDIEVSFSMSLKSSIKPLNDANRLKNELIIPEITYGDSSDASRPASPSSPSSIVSKEPFGWLKSPTASREPSPSLNANRDELKLPKLKKSPSSSRSSSSTSPDTPKKRIIKKEESISVKKIEVTSEEIPSTSTIEETSAKKGREQEKLSPREDVRLRGGAKSPSRIGDLLKKLQRNDTPPLTMAVSSYANRKFDPDPTKRSDSESSDSSGAKIIPLMLEKKTVTETKTTIKKKTVTKESTMAEKDNVQNENSNSDSCEINFTLKTTVKNGEHKSSDKTNVAYEISETTVEKQQLKKKTSNESQFTNETTLKMAEKLGIDHKKAEDGVELKNGRIKAMDEAQTKATLSSKISNKEVDSSTAVVEAKKTQRFSIGIDGDEVKFEVEIEQKLISEAEEKPKLKKALKETSNSDHHNHDESAKSTPTPKKKVVFSVPNDENEKSKSKDDNPAVFDIRKLWPEPGSKRLFSEAKRANRETTPPDRQHSLPNQFGHLSHQEEDEFAFHNLKAQLMKWMVAEENYETWKEKQLNNVKREVTATGNVKKAMNKWKHMEQKFGK